MNPPTPTYPIETERLMLRPFEDEDLDDIFLYHSRPEVVRFLYWSVRSRDETQQTLERRKSETQLAGEGSRLSLAVECTKMGQVIGEVSLYWRSETHQQGEIGFVFNPTFYGHGYATEATEAMLAFGFESLALHRIYGRCDARNIASLRLMERLGMQREAHFRHNEIFKGEWGDELVYAMLQEEWVARSAR